MLEIISMTYCNFKLSRRFVPMDLAFLLSFGSDDKHGTTIIFRRLVFTFYYVVRLFE